MEKIKKGDIVGRKSYGKDILFSVKNIIDTPRGKIAILRGIIDRIEADSYIEDLEKIDKKYIKQEMTYFEDRLNKRLEAVAEYNNSKISQIKKYNSKRKKLKDIVTPVDRTFQKILTGKILHIDGDKKYSEKSFRYYQKLGLNVIVKNIPEYRQPRVIYSLLKVYKPDILVVTGHDGMIKKGTGFYDLYNYRNSRYFVETVKEARRYDKEEGKNLVIFARSMSKLL